MKELLESVGQLTSEELKRSYINFPAFRSGHEAYGVIREEIEEHRDDTRDMKAYFKIFWNHIKHDDVDRAREWATELRDKSIHAAAEATQVSAMCQKFLDSTGGEIK